MAVRCPECMREYDVTLFEFEREIKCVCGSIVKLQHKEAFIEADQIIEDKNILEIRRDADRIAYLIAGTDYPGIDIEIEKGKLRDRIEELFPDKAHLYELIYEPRFIRLDEQFRRGKDE